MGLKNSNIKDVARRAGVSTATVSHVLNDTKNVSEETRKRVLKAVEGLQYQPNQQARSLRLGHGREILVLVDETCLAGVVAPALIAKLVTALQKRYSHVITYFFDTAEQVVAILQQQDFYSAYVLSNHPMRRQWVKWRDGVLFLNLSLEECSNHETNQMELDLGDFFYQEVDSCLQNGDFSQIVMNYRQGNVFKRLSLASNFEKVCLLPSEISSGAYFIQGITGNKKIRILFADYALFVGATKYLMQHEDILFSRNLEIEYLPWSKSVETYGLPLEIRELPIEAMINLVLERSSTT